MLSRIFPSRYQDYKVYRGGKRLDDNGIEQTVPLAYVCDVQVDVQAQKPLVGQNDAGRYMICLYNGFLDLGADLKRNDILEAANGKQYRIETIHDYRRYSLLTLEAVMLNG